MIKLEKLRHIAIIVADTKKMTDFYTNILGLKLVNQVDIDAPFLAKGVGVPGAKAKMSHLAVENSDAMIEMFEFTDKLGPDKNISCSNAQGYRHMAFELTNIDEVYTDLKEEGVEFVSEVMCLEGGPNAGFKFVYFKDPEGNLIELTQLPKP
ncbi:MAG: VOC family protein [bacterium]